MTLIGYNSQTAMTLIGYNSQTVHNNETKLSDISHMSVVSILRPILARSIFWVGHRLTAKTDRHPRNAENRRFWLKMTPNDEKMLI